MNNPQDIETIIRSFEKFALADIIHNKSKPIAAFILSVCFIDQLSAFRYSEKISKRKRPEKFINDYMLAYSGLKLYNYVRHSLVHYYSSEGRFAVTNEDYKQVPYMAINKKIFINTDVFIEALENAFKEVSKDFRNKKSQAYYNALARSKTHPVLADTVN